MNERRTFSLKTVFYGLVLARRRHARRDTDHLTAPMDWYSPRLFALALGIILFSVLDAVLTLHLLSNGASEANPVMAFFLQHGVWSFVSAKMALTAVPLLLLTALSNYALFNRIRIATLFPLLLLSYHVLIVYEAVLISGIWH
ncbi:MAG TPA: hypothetical protein EYH03_02795 [Chromatiales bacterium]|nr:hypothetical protein [Chromatiales bacterium]